MKKIKSDDLSIYKESMQGVLHQKEVMVERTILLFSPISVLFLLDTFSIIKALMGWVFLKQSFLSNLVWVGYSLYIMLPLILLIFLYNIYEIKREVRCNEI